jgi:hypothetical protein
LQRIEHVAASDLCSDDRFSRPAAQLPESVTLTDLQATGLATGAIRRVDLAGPGARLKRLRELSRKCSPGEHQQREQIGDDENR